MRFWWCTTFEGFYPVGTSAIAIAPDLASARKAIAAAVSRAGLEFRDEDDVLELTPGRTGRPRALVLQDGDY